MSGLVVRREGKWGSRLRGRRRDGAVGTRRGEATTQPPSPRRPALPSPDHEHHPGPSLVAPLWTQLGRARLLTGTVCLTPPCRPAQSSFWAVRDYLAPVRRPAPSQALSLPVRRLRGTGADTDENATNCRGRHRSSRRASLRSTAASRLVRRRLASWLLEEALGGAQIRAAKELASRARSSSSPPSATLKQGSRWGSPRESRPGGCRAVCEER